MSESSVFGKARKNGKIMNVYKCAYCGLLAKEDEVAHNTGGRGTDFIVCLVCHERLRKCPHCQMNSSIPASVPNPKDEHEVWYSPA